MDYAQNNYNNPSSKLERPFKKIELDNEDRTEIRSSFINSLFVVFDEVTKLHIQSFFFYLPRFLFLIIEFFDVIFFTYLPTSWNDSTGIGKVMVNLNGVIAIGQTNNSQNLNYLKTFFPLFYNLVIFAFFVFIIVHARRNGIIPKPMAYIAAFFFQILLFIGYIPTFVGFAHIFKFLYLREPIAILAFFLYIFSITFITTGIIFVSRLTCFCPNPTKYSFTTFNGGHIPLNLIINGVTIDIMKVAELVSDWFYIFAIILNICLVSYLIYDLFGFPFVKIWVNKFFAAVYTMQITSDIVTLLFISGIYIHPLLRLLLPIGILIVSYIVFHFIFQFQIKKIEVLLDSEVSADTNIFNYCESLNITTVKQITTYTRVGLSLTKPLIIVGTFSFIMGQKFNSYEYYLLVASIMTFIPSNKPFLNNCIEKLSSMEPNNIINKLLYQRLLKINQGFEFVSSGDIQYRLQMVMDKTQESIRQIKKFWFDVSKQDKNVNVINSINSISSLIKETNALWKDSLILYPNEPKVAYEYSNFLLECKGKFETAIIWQLKSMNMEQGISFEINQLFRAFAIALPNVYWNGIVDKLGNIKFEFARNNLSAYSGITIPDDGKRTEDIEAEMIAKVADNTLKWPNLRMQFSKATENYKPLGLPLGISLKYLAFIGWMILLIIQILFFLDTPVSVNDTYNRMDYISGLRSGIASLNSIVFLNFARQKGLLFTEEEYKNALPKEAIDEEAYGLINVSNFSASFDEILHFTIGTYIKFYKTFAGKDTYRQSISYSLAPFHDEFITQTRIINQEEQTRITSPKNAFIFLIWNYFQYSNFFNSSEDNFFNSSSVYESIKLHIEFSQGIDVALSNYSNQVDVYYSQLKHYIEFFFYFDSILIIFVAIPLISLPFLLISFEINKSMKAIKSINPKGALAASQSLSINNDLKINFKTVIENENSTFKFILIIILSIFLHIVIIVLSTISCDVLISQTVNNVNIIKISRYALICQSLIFEILSYVSSISIYSQVENQFFPVQIVESVYLRAIRLVEEYENLFILGDNNIEGIYSFSDEIRDLYTNDKCTYDSNSAILHNYYKCASFTRLIRIFLNYAQDFSDSYSVGLTLDNNQFINFLHLTSVEMYNNLADLHRLIDSLIQNQYNITLGIPLLLLVISLLLIIIDMVVDFYLQRKILRFLHTIFILIRHVPPTVIAETPEIINILVHKTNENQITRAFDPKQLIFQETQYPIIFLGSNYIIEIVNQSFMDVYKYKIEQVVGQFLYNIIENPINSIDSNDTKIPKGLSPEDQGAVKMYRKLKYMFENNTEVRCNYPIKCICGNGKEMRTVVSAHPIRNQYDLINNFVLILEDRRENNEIEDKLENLQNTYSALLSQLIPQKISLLLKNKGNNFSLKLDQVTLTAVQVFDGYNLIDINLKYLSTYSSIIENVAKSFPSLIRVKTLYDTFIYIGGILSNEEMNKMIKSKISEQEESYPDYFSAHSIGENESSVEDNSNEEEESKDNQMNYFKELLKLSSEDLLHPEISIRFAIQLKDALMKKLPANKYKADKPKFKIAIITGGPVFCYLSNENGIANSLEVIGETFDKSLRLINATPRDSILVTESTMSLVERQGIENIQCGSKVLDMNTFVI